MVVALALWLAHFSVQVVGDGGCPTPAEVDRRLKDLLPAPGEGVAQDPIRHRARVSRSDRGVHIELLGTDGARIADRDLEAGGSCDDLASALAIVIAAWETELDPQIAFRVELPSPPAKPDPGPMSVAASPLASEPGPSFAVRLGLLASLAGGQIAPGARIEAWMAPRGRQLGLGVALSGTTFRTEAVGPRADAARWMRLSLGVGPESRFDAGPVTLDAHVQALVALLRVEGVGLSTTASDTTGQIGAGLGAKVGWIWGNAAPWIGADLAFWPGRDRLEIGGLTAQGQLPRIDVQMAFGLSLGRFP